MVLRSIKCDILCVMKLMAIDGNSVVNRAFYGVRHLSASDGTPTNAIYGFLAILHKLIAEESPDALCVCFDLPAPTFRHEKYVDYKAHRKPMPDDLAVQMPILKEVLDAMNITRYEVSGWEADDLLGTIANICQSKNTDCVIVTGDKDSFQLVSDHVIVKHIKTRGGKTETIDYTPEVFEREYGFEPVKMIDLKALMGDSSDNIPGIAGVGEKTALELVRKFGSLKRIYDNIDKLDIKDTLKTKLKNGQESALLSYALAEICTSVPFDFSPEDTLREQVDEDKLYTLFKRLRFNSFMEKYKLRPSAEKSESPSLPTPEIVEVSSTDDAKSLLEAAKTAGQVAIEIDLYDFDIIAVSIPSDKKVHVLKRDSIDNFSDICRTLLSDEIKKVGHNVKNIMRACLDREIPTGSWAFDTALAAYLISPTDPAYTIQSISEKYCGFSPGGICDDKSAQMSLLSDFDSSKAIAEQAHVIGYLYVTLDRKLKKLGSSSLYHDVELPLCSVLAEMESIGFLVDKQALHKFGADLSVRINQLENQIYEHAHEKFNINSPKQLGVILFEKLMLPAQKKTKTGYSTNIEVLDFLADKHPIINCIKEYRELTKLKSTYADGLLKVIADDGRVHTHFQMTVTATGRLSSTEPNLQNIPVRRELGGEIRKMFVSAPGMVLVDADYSQIELRLLAHIAQDETMINAFKNGDDIHTVTASQVFGVPLDEVTDTERFRAKAVNFGIVYGISAFSLAADIGVSQSEAKRYIDAYLENYSGVREYMKNVVKKAKENGFVTTLFGRRRDLPEILSSNFNTRSFGERVALNMPIQGTAADIIKIAMIMVHDRLKRDGLRAALVLQVHDELIVECPDSESAQVSIILREEMERAAALSVPLLAETSVGKSWYDAK